MTDERSGYRDVSHMEGEAIPDKRDSDGTTQTDKFKEAAREAECDEDEARWEDHLKKVANQKPEKPE